MARYGILHKTTYDYQFPVSTSHHYAHLKPLQDAGQTCELFSLNIDPSSTDLIERLDFFENTIHMFSVQETHAQLVVEARSTVDVALQTRNLADLTTPWTQAKLAHLDYSQPSHVDTKPFLYHTESTPDLAGVEAFGNRFFREAKPIGESLAEMLKAFATEFEFDAKATDVNTSVQEVIKSKRGVCQDFSHLMIAALRSCKIATRYVSGYILTHPPEGEQRLLGADASHAWISAFDPVHGWVDLDPTNNRVCGDQHVRIAYGRDYTDVSMLGGAVTGGGEQIVSVEVTMQPLEET